MTPVKRSNFDRDYVRIEAYREHPLLRALEVQAPLRPPTWRDSVWLHVVAAVLLVGLISLFGWVCGAVGG